ncbi:hypothetical protein AMS57_00240 [Pseudoalteromonas undina]|uniref:hypothetical protein n=1 Tax=Pseudoalteromonas undina TaxID=43660 RepID=UPI0006BB18CB|nr:hypothetical protein [Pseudoalteromonas undina]KPH92000.1 hypothetical protein AMS57_00240 [Pseudoalteromonas undina]
MSNKRLVILIWILTILGLILYPLSLAYKVYYITLPAFAFGFMVPFAALLNLYIDRVTKGLLLIANGILWGIFYTDLYIEITPEDIKSQLEIYKNFALFMCTGAGGSIIAAHSEALHHESSNKTLILDKTREIHKLDKNVYSLQKSFQKMSYIIIFLLILILLVLFFK